MKKLKAFIKKNPILLKYSTMILNKDSRKTKIKKNIKGKGNIIKVGKSSLLNNCVINIEGNENVIIVESSCFLKNVVFFIKGNNNKILISKSVRFNRDGLLWIEDKNCLLDIGEESSFESTHLAVTEPNSIIKIGKDCMFAYDIDVRTGDSHSIIDTITKKRINYAKNVFIGNHVWIASHVSILKGVNIPNNSVIATRSLVTKQFDKANILIGGSPAKLLKENIDWDRSRIYD